MKSYAGIGSRETPVNILEEFQQIGTLLAQKGYVLRSGHAPGADSAFEAGADQVSGKKEIFLPWKGFEGSDSKLYQVTEEAFEIAAKFHPRWEAISSIGSKKLLARDVYQVLGYDLKHPSDFIICYTKNGMGSGGTGQAIRIARANTIRIFDFGNVDAEKEFHRFINDKEAAYGV